MAAGIAAVHARNRDYAVAHLAVSKVQGLAPAAGPSSGFAEPYLGSVSHAVLGKKAGGQWQSVLRPIAAAMRREGQRQVIYMAVDLVKRHTLRVFPSVESMTCATWGAGGQRKALRLPEAHDAA